MIQIVVNVPYDQDQAPDLCAADIQHVLREHFHPDVDVTFIHPLYR